MSTKTESKSAAERAYSFIRGQILDGDHPPGTMLGEAALAAEIEVSRTPVRVALARLQDEGWIHIYPKRGAIVQGVDERTIVELADARYVLETTAVERASEPLRQSLTDTLTELISQQRAAFAEADIARFIELTLEFHRGFVEAGDNQVMLEMYSMLSDRHRFILFMNGRHLLNRCDEIIAEHEALVNHLRAGASEEFAATLQGHIEENAGPQSAGFGVR
ncbi:MAG: GntR family transcriptional regulator [Brevibacterium sp.]|uniref:GntR family transcriptional regulator n=1 Tax=unclassified Brevibacterium TaxID=2614124 RepID=UPI001081378E|nr:MULTISPECIES: GntR family transcriptional regulator [unclassified Brevibacterium]TGD11684.1 GntR family transcriptional regulator [Brevibacterium sp. S111]TGD31938.1 GntR family transcriptional regulator [Brevibacterium sp. S22]